MCDGKKWLNKIKKYGLTAHEVYFPQSVIQQAFICNG